MYQNNRASQEKKAQIRVSQVFWDPIQIRGLSRSAVLKAAYLKALLYLDTLILIAKLTQLSQFLNDCMKTLIINMD